MTPIFINKRVFLESRRSSSRMLGKDLPLLEKLYGGIMAALMARPSGSERSTL
jgi:hypothetical protein